VKDVNIMADKLVEESHPEEETITKRKDVSMHFI